MERFSSLGRDAISIAKFQLICGISCPGPLRVFQGVPSMRRSDKIWLLEGASITLQTLHSIPDCSVFNKFPRCGWMCLEDTSDSPVCPSDLKTVVPVSFDERHRSTCKSWDSSLLAGEQSDTFRKSQHRGIKKQRRYERLAATNQLSLW